MPLRRVKNEFFSSNNSILSFLINFIVQPKYKFRILNHSSSSRNYRIQERQVTIFITKGIEPEKIRFSSAFVYYNIIITLMLFKFQIKFVDDILDCRFSLNPKTIIMIILPNPQIKVVLFKIVKCTTGNY